MLRLEKLKRTADRFQKDRWAKDPVLYFEERLNVKMFDKLAEVLESVRDNPRTFVYSGNGVGKCLPLDAPVMLADGTFTELRNVKFGDMVMCYNIHTGVSHPTAVVGVTRAGMMEVFETKFSDGGIVRCTKEHKMVGLLRSGKSEKYKPNEPVKREFHEYWKYVGAKSPSRRPRFLSPKTVEYGNSGELPIAPYALGALLGDGGLTIRTVTLTTKDKSVLDRVALGLAPLISGVSERKYKDRCPSYAFLQKDKKLNAALKSIGLLLCKSGDKHIPKQYMTASRADRLQLLAGLIDTDGTHNEFTSKSKQLAEDFCTIVRSLGGRSSVKHSWRTCTNASGGKKKCEAWRVYYRLNEEIPLSLAYKQQRISKRAINYDQRVIRSIKSLGEMECGCITVAHPDHCFIAYDWVAVGNTYTAGGIPIWWMECFYPSVVLITGSSWGTIKDTILPRIRSYMRAGKIFDKDPNKTEIWLSDNHFLTARSTNNPENIAGLHSPNILQLVEESSGVDRQIAEAISGNATGDHSRELWLGNPLRPSGYFYEAIREKAGNVIQISALDHPNIKEGREIITGAVTRTNIEQRVKEYKCRPAAPNQAGAFHLYWKDEWIMPTSLFQSRILGEFPSQTDDSLYNERLLRQAMLRANKEWKNTDGSFALGCDVARYGDDETVIAFAYKNGVPDMNIYHGRATTETAGTITQLNSEIAFVGIGVDEGGVGGGVVDILRENNIGTMGLSFGSASYEPERFANLKTEMYFKFKEALEENPDFEVPDDEEFIKQAADIRYNITAKGQYMIEPKEKTKKRTGTSPDRLEAAIIAWYVYQYYQGGGTGLEAYLTTGRDDDGGFAFYQDRNPIEDFGLRGTY